MLNLKKITGLAAAALMASAVSASAVSFTISSAATATADPNQLAPTSVSPNGGGVGPYTGDINNIRRSVWYGTAGSVANDPYFAVIPNTGDPAGSPSTSATYQFGASKTSFSFLWGSPDNENKIEFFNGNTSVGSVTGLTLMASAGFAGAGGVANSIGVVVNFFDFSSAFDRIVLSSAAQGTNRNSFEYANVVPLPAAAWLLLAGLGGMGLVARRRKAAA